MMNDFTAKLYKEELEPLVNHVQTDPDTSLTSIAISVKRIADALEKVLEKAEEFANE